MEPKEKQAGTTEINISGMLEGQGASVTPQPFPIDYFTKFELKDIETSLTSSIEGIVNTSVNYSLEKAVSLFAEQALKTSEHLLKSGKQSGNAGERSREAGSSYQ
jgi:hypothetical protein